MQELILKYGDLPKTFYVKTGGGGGHAYFSYPKDGQRWGNKAGFLQGLDIRAEGGYVVAPPSLHESGEKYTVLYDTDIIADAPTRLLDLIKPNQTKNNPIEVPISFNDVLNNDHTDIIKRAKAYLAKDSGAIQGSGGDTHTFSLARSFTRLWLIRK